MSGPLFTFGDSRAAQSLIRILNQYPKAQSKISRYLSHSFTLMNAIPMIPNQVNRSLLNIVYKHQLASLALLTDLPEEVISYTKNVLNTKYKIKYKLLHENYRCS
jgi:hypothetical protein